MSYTGLVQPTAMTSIEEVIDDTTPLINKVYSSDRVQSEIDVVESAGAISSYATSAVSVTVATPVGRNISVLDYTGATGTITLPASSGMTIGGRVLIKKRNATMGSVNINKAGTDAVQWGAAQLRLYSDGDYWLVMWDGIRWCLLDGYETGSNANGEYVKYANGTLICTRTVTTPTVAAGGYRNAASYPLPATLISYDNIGVSCSYAAGTDWQEAVNATAFVLSSQGQQWNVYVNPGSIIQGVLAHLTLVGRWK